MYQLPMGRNFAGPEVAVAGSEGQSIDSPTLCLRNHGANIMPVVSGAARLSQLGDPNTAQVIV